MKFLLDGFEDPNHAPPVIFYVKYRCKMQDSTESKQHIFNRVKSKELKSNVITRVVVDHIL